MCVSMVRVKEFIDASEKDINDFLANTNAKFISFHQSSSSREVTVEGYKKLIPTVVIHIVYDNNATGGMR